MQNWDNDRIQNIEERVWKYFHGRNQDLLTREKKEKEQKMRRRRREKEEESPEHENVAFFWGVL